MIVKAERFLVVLASMRNDRSQKRVHVLTVKMTPLILVEMISFGLVMPLYMVSLLNI